MSAKFRPTFKIKSRQTFLDAGKSINSVVTQNSNKCMGQFKDRHALISITEAKRHFWSPWLTLNIQDSKMGCTVFGRFSPHPSIWTGFMFSYLALAVLVFFSLVFGASQVLAGQSSFAFLGVPIWCLIAVGLWLASQTGQRLAHSEMEFLYRLVHDSVAEDSVAEDAVANDEVGQSE